MGLLRGFFCSSAWWFYLIGPTVFVAAAFVSLDLDEDGHTGLATLVGFLAFAVPIEARICFVVAHDRATSLAMRRCPPA
ncbi:MAG: hypothetical protein ACI8TP_001737 [Acidimicrobiales bacterium]